MRDLLELKTKDFPLAARSISILTNAGYLCESDFSSAREAEIKNLRGLGPVLLAELKLFLKGRGITLKRDIREKRELKYNPRSRELVKILLPKGEINFSREVPIAGKLLEIYKYENLERVKLPSHVSTLAWLYSGVGGWSDRFIGSFAPIELVDTPQPEQKKEETIIETREYKKADKPKTLQEFLGLRK